MWAMMNYSHRIAVLVFLFATTVAKKVVAIYMMKVLFDSGRGNGIQLLIYLETVTDVCIADVLK